MEVLIKEGVGRQIVQTSVTAQVMSLQADFPLIVV